MNEVQVVNSSQDTALYLITKAEIDQQVSTAKAFPRSLKESLDSALSMATLTEDIAESCSYSMPRGGKNLEGPSVRLAEIVCSAYGNIRYGARVIENDGKTVTAQGICHDLEKNTCATVEVKKSILQHEKVNGQRTGRMIPMQEDMQVVIGNAACAIAFRNAVFKVIPAAIVSSIYEQAKQVAKGTLATLITRRDKAVQWFNENGIKNEQICSALSIKKIEDIDLDKLAVLSGMRAAVKNGESTIKELFEVDSKETKKAKSSITSAQMKEAIKDIQSGEASVDDVATKFELTPEQLTELTNAVLS
jgi:hypothetical protein